MLTGSLYMTFQELLIKEGGLAFIGNHEFQLFCVELIVKTDAL